MQWQSLKKIVLHVNTIPEDLDNDMIGERLSFRCACDKYEKLEY